jgi:hypothetical protein
MAGPHADPAREDQAQRIRALHAQGASIRTICKDVFGYAGGRAYDVVKAVLASGITITDHDADGPAAIIGD